MTLSPGTRLGSYEVSSQIGIGGMGEVYRARDTNLKRFVAIKVLPESVSGDADRLARFQREAEVLATLNHPNIATIYGLERSGGMAAFVMELVEGPTLADRISQGAIPVDEALPIATQIAEALEAAHEKGIIHRDLKPANIKLRPDGVVKVLDFGLAKLSDKGSHTDSPERLSISPTLTSPAMITGVGTLLGTAAYMSPEQAKGQALDGRADIWAFGTVLWEMLTGRTLFPGDHVSEVLASVLRQEVDLTTLPSDTPASVRRLLRLCLERNPKNRLHHMADVRLALADGRDPDEAATKASIPRPRRVFLRWAPWAVSIAIAGIAAVLLSVPRAPSSGVSSGPRRVEIVGVSVAQSSNVAISPDGAEIIAYDMTPGRPILQRRSVNSFTIRQINGTENGFNPFFSPDGRQIGFFSAGQLCVIPLEGGNRRCLAEAHGFATGNWGPDGTIVFADGATTKERPAGLWRVPAAGGTAQRLTQIDPAAGEIGHVYPQMLPDGRHVIFNVIDGRQPYLAAVPTSGGMPTTLVPSAMRGRYVRSGHLVYWDRGRGELRATAFDPVTLALGEASAGLGESVDSSTVIQTGDTQPAFEISDEGTLVYATGAFFDENFTVDLVDSTGRSTPLIDEIASWTQPRLSPDGRTLLLRQAAQPDCSLWLFDLDRRSLSRLSQDGDHHNPLWARDGRSVLFSFQSAAGLRQVYEQSIDGSAGKLAVSTSFPTQAESISGDGRYLALTYDARRERNDILIHDRMTGQTTPLMTTDFDEDYPGFSPKSELLAYVSNETGRPEVYVRPFPASGQKQRISTGGGTGPIWSHDGRTLYYAEGSRMMRVAVTLSPRFTAGTPERLFESVEFVWDRPRNYEVLADNRTFVMIRRSQVGSAERRLRLVFGWFEELKRLVPAN